MCIMAKIRFMDVIPTVEVDQKVKETRIMVVRISMGLDLTSKVPEVPLPKILRRSRKGLVMAL